MTGDLRGEAERIAAEIRARGKKVLPHDGELWVNTSAAEKILHYSRGYLRKLRERGQAPRSWSFPPGSPSAHHWYEIKTLLGWGRISESEIYFREAC